MTLFGLSVPGKTRTLLLPVGVGLFANTDQAGRKPRRYHAGRGLYGNGNGCRITKSARQGFIDLVVEQRQEPLLDSQFRQVAFTGAAG